MAWHSRNQARCPDKDWQRQQVDIWPSSDNVTLPVMTHRTRLVRTGTPAFPNHWVVIMQANVGSLVPALLEEPEGDIFLAISTKISFRDWGKTCLDGDGWSRLGAKGPWREATASKIKLLNDRVDS